MPADFALGSNVGEPVKYYAKWHKPDKDKYGYPWTLIRSLA